ncbi:MAG: glycerol-3-phosphate acyltransferase [Pseudothermotoga sp.]
MIWLPLVLGYLLGSFLPAYFLTKWITGIDVRTVGTHHAGTTNVYRVAGFAPAMVTAVYDLLKGILAVFISNSLGYPEWVLM